MLRKSFFGIMALIIGVMLIFTACDTGNGDNGSQQQQGTAQTVTYVSEDNDGNLYTLEIIESLPNRSARYTAKQGDSFKLTVELYNGVDYSIGLVYEGTVGSTTANGEKIVINITVNNKQLKITIVGNEMTVIEGEIVDTNGQAVVDTPEELSTFIDKRALETALVAANMAKQDVVVNVNGTDVAKNVYWVTQAQMDTFTAAIATAQAFYDETDADQSMVNSARITLVAATNVFNGQKKFGTKEEVQNPEQNIWIAGSYTVGENGQACYWFNGIRTNLANGTNAMVRDMEIVGTDVYIAGSSGSNPCYWKNGILVSLSGASGAMWAEGIAVSGNDIYVVASDNNGGIFEACYWKNGTKTVLPGNDARARDIVIIGNDVYITGEYVDSVNGFTACYWKNGVRFDLPFSEGTSGGAVNITSDGENFYILGFYSPAGSLPYGYCYWTNGSGRVNFASTNSSAMVRKIVAQDSKIYVAADYSLDGSNYNSAYWINGIKTELPIVGTFSQINDMAVIGENVHIIGIEDYGNGPETVYWINGVRQEYPVTGYGNLIAINRN